jgi:integrase
MDATSTTSAPLYRVAIGLGLRQGELLGLRWSDVNLEIRHSRTHEPGRWPSQRQTAVDERSGWVAN